MASVAKKRGSYPSRQRRMGPAPFASFEDLSDEVESPEDKASRPLPGIKEDVNMASDGTLMSPSVPVPTLQTPSTPRIDISRASSSSHHESGDSRDSTPERELFTGSMGLGFKEEGAEDLRSSTEELDYHGDEMEKEAQSKRDRLLRRKEKGKQTIFKYELEAQSEKEAKERKDSACSVYSDAFLSISGRTSRLSSIGSVASGGSGASGLSVASALSGGSSASGLLSGRRSPSPHKMLLETSFCGNKPIPTPSLELDSPPAEPKHETESLEKVLLSKKAELANAARQADGKVKRETHGGSVPKSGDHHKTQTLEREKPASLDLESSTRVAKPVQTFPQVLKETPAKPLDPLRKSQSRPTTPKPVTMSSSMAEMGSKSLSTTPSASPKLARHAFLKKAGNGEADKSSRTPSPSTSRKTSLSSLFKRSDGPLSPESPPPGKRKSSLTSKLKEASEGLRERSRSRSKSGERTSAIEHTASDKKVDTKGKKDSKNKSVFSSLFKKKEKKRSKATENDTSAREVLSPDSAKISDAITNVEFTFNSEGNYQPSEFGMIRAESEGRHAKQKQTLEKNVTRKPTDKTAGLQKPEHKHAPVVHEEEKKKEDKPSASKPTIDIPRESTDSQEPDDDKILTPGYEMHNGYSQSEDSQRTSQGDDAAKFEPLPDSEAITVSQETLQNIPSVPETDHHSSESEKEVEVEYVKAKETSAEPEAVVDHEWKGLVLQDSFEDELPYVPTTLPLERSVAVPIIPVRQRISEVKTFPIERPRSTTPINPCSLEDYMSHTSSSDEKDSVEKMRICLPREDSITKAKSPRRITARSWVEFAEQGLQSPREYRKITKQERVSGPSPPNTKQDVPESPPPPLPPRASQPPLPPKTWINFEAIPEKRKPPKRIQTIPSRGTIDIPESTSAQGNGQSTQNTNDGSSASQGTTKGHGHQRVVYSYVNPEDCKCECHENVNKPVSENGVDKSGATEKTNGSENNSPVSVHSEMDSVDANGLPSDEKELAGARLDVDYGADRRSYQSDSSFEYPSPYNLEQECEYSDGLKPMKPFGMDLDVRSNRSSIISQDEPQSPEEGSSSNGNEVKPQ